MLYYIYTLLGDNPYANLLRYQTFRSFVAFVISFLFVWLIEPKFINWFKVHKLGQPIRDDGPKSHFSKKGTPTMGGVVVVLGVILASLICADLSKIYVWVSLFVLISFSILGFIDDYRKVSFQNTKGVSARSKLLWQILISIIALTSLVSFIPDYETTLRIPFLKNLYIELGYFYIPFAALVIVGAANAVNLTDGLDGLVTGPTITVALAYGVFAYIAGNAVYAKYLQVLPVNGAGDLTIVASAIVGSGLGFLWYNSYPAQVFMGDVGSLGLGGLLGVMAVITHQELVLIIAGGVFVMEALSVIIQVALFKMTGKRVLKMAPIHHHFELNGVSEPKIIVRCWIISLILAVLSIATLKLR